MYNNYNPYYGQQRFQMEQPQQMMVQPIQQSMYTPLQNKQFLNGKVVESIDVVKSLDTNMDGSVNYYPIADGSAIVTKQMQLDGKPKIITYKPVIEEEEELPKYVTFEDLDKVVNKLNETIKNIDLSDIEDLKDKISDIKDEIKELKKKKKDE